MTGIFFTAGTVLNYFLVRQCSRIHHVKQQSLYTRLSCTVCMSPCVPSIPLEEQTHTHKTNTLRVLALIWKKLVQLMQRIFKSLKKPRLLEVNTHRLHALQDDRINRAEVLFPGVGCFLIAAILGLFVHASNTDDINAKLGIKRGHWLSNVTAKDAHEAPAGLGAALSRSGLVGLRPCSSDVF